MHKQKKQMKNVIIAMALISLLILLGGGGCDDKKDQQNTACIDRDNCIKQKQAQGIDATKANELCGPKPQGCP